MTAQATALFSYRAQWHVRCGRSRSKVLCQAARTPQNLYELLCLSPIDVASATPEGLKQRHRITKSVQIAFACFHRKRDLMNWWYDICASDLRFWYLGYSLALFCKPRSFLGGLQARGSFEINQDLLDLLIYCVSFQCSQGSGRYCGCAIQILLVLCLNGQASTGAFVLFCVVLFDFLIAVSNSCWNVWFSLRWRWRSANFSAYWGRPLAKHFTGPCLSSVEGFQCSPPTTGDLFVSHCCLSYCRCFRSFSFWLWA